MLKKRLSFAGADVMRQVGDVIAGVAANVDKPHLIANALVIYMCFEVIACACLVVPCLF